MFFRKNNKQINQQSKIITEEILIELKREFPLKWNGTHGIVHWARVRENGLYLAEHTGAKTHIIELFAIFHDVKRIKDGPDPEHGLRGAKYATLAQKSLFSISYKDFQILYEACAYHTSSLQNNRKEKKIQFQLLYK